MSEEKLGKIIIIPPAHPLVEFEFRGKIYRAERMTRARAVEYQALAERMRAGEVTAVFDAAAFLLAGEGQEVPADMVLEEAQALIEQVSIRLFRFGGGATGEGKKGSGPGPTGSPA